MLICQCNVTQVSTVIIYEFQTLPSWDTLGTRATQVMLPVAALCHCFIFLYISLRIYKCRRHTIHLAALSSLQWLIIMLIWFSIKSIFFFPNYDNQTIKLQSSKLQSLQTFVHNLFLSHWYSPIKRRKKMLKLYLSVQILEKKIALKIILFQFWKKMKSFSPPTGLSNDIVQKIKQHPSSLLLLAKKRKIFVCLFILFVEIIHWVDWTLY